MTNHDHLCPELRLQALCLPIPDRNTGGRPGLSFKDRRDVRILWNEIAGGLARLGQSSRDPGLNPKNLAPANAAQVTVGLPSEGDLQSPG
jgi:hypothetical protein